MPIEVTAFSLFLSTTERITMAKKTDNTDEGTTSTQEQPQAEGKTVQPEAPRTAATPRGTSTAETKTLTNKDGKEVRTNMNVVR